jgi:hypothetical protein
MVVACGKSEVKKNTLEMAILRGQMIVFEGRIEYDDCSYVPL